MLSLWARWGTGFSGVRNVARASSIWAERGQHALYGTQGKIRETKRAREERGREREEKERANQWFLQ